MNEARINVEVPFDWCSQCRRFDAVTDHYYAVTDHYYLDGDDGEAYYSRTHCDNEDICKEADRARRANDKKED